MSQRDGIVRNGVKLPAALQKELGIQHGDGPRRGSAQKDSASQISARKIERQAMRKLKRTGDSTKETTRRSSLARVENQIRGENQGRQLPQRQERQREQMHRPSPPKPKPKPALKKSLRRQSSPMSDTSSSTRSSSPGLVLDASSKTYKERSAQDDAEIAALEKRLGLSKRKSNATGDDMLDYLLEGLEDEGSHKQELRTGREWLANKRRKVNHSEDDEDDEGASFDEDSGEDVDLDEDDMGNLDLDDVADFPSDQSSENEDLDDVDSNDFTAFNSEDPGDLDEQPVKKVRENPYVAPVDIDSNIQRYVPPSQRNKTAGDETSISRLKRQIQGHLNKLSEANIISILGEIEILYRGNARQDVTTSLIDLLLSSFSSRSALQNTFIILHAAFVAAMYKVMGTDFGAEILVRLVEHIDEQRQHAQSDKQALNSISLLANLFTFGVISSHVVYDYIRLLLDDFNEANAELLLRVVRDCGPQLRSDDPSALKGIVQMVQNISSEMAKKGQQLNVRTRVMMDTIIDLKNNKMKNATNAAGLTGEHITRMRKALGSLNSRNLKATEPLRITKQDIESSDKKGKWWLVGASWKGNQGEAPASINNAESNLVQNSYQTHDQEVDFLALAKQFRMNTDVRRSIFVAIMSAGDVRDAQIRLLKLRLSSKQEQEIAKVLLRCTRAEPAYNPYYSLLAKNLCKENRKIRIGLQFGLWSFFNAMGEKADEDDSDAESDDQDVGMNEIVNVAKMYAYLVFQQHLTLGILKTLNIGFLKEKATMFLEVFIISIITQPRADEEALLKAFGRAAETPQIVKSLQYFIKKFVRHSDLISKTDRKRVKDGCRVADVALTMVNSAEMEMD